MLAFFRAYLSLLLKIINIRKDMYHVTPRPHVVHGPGPPKMTFRYLSGAVIITHIFGKANYCSFILCMITMLNE